MTFLGLCQPQVFGLGVAFCAILGHLRGPKTKIFGLAPRLVAPRPRQAGYCRSRSKSALLGRALYLCMALWLKDGGLQASHSYHAQDPPWPLPSLWAAEPPVAPRGTKSGPPRVREWWINRGKPLGPAARGRGGLPGAGGPKSPPSTAEGPPWRPWPPAALAGPGGLGPPPRVPRPLPQGPDLGRWGSFAPFWQLPHVPGCISQRGGPLESQIRPLPATPHKSPKGAKAPSPAKGEAPAATKGQWVGGGNRRPPNLLRPQATLGLHHTKTQGNETARDSTPRPTSLRALGWVQGNTLRREIRSPHPKDTKGVRKVSW